MPASVAEFVKAAEDSGILTSESLAEYARGVAPDTDATALANRLVKDGRLTAFQAKYIYGGKAKSLVLGPYIVLDMLGKGGMGYVYKAEHRKMRRVVALKVIAKNALKSPAAVQRFEREVQAAARLEHPNIVTAHDAGEAAGTHYLVMQFVDGRNLSEVVKELGPQPVGRAVDWVLQAARGLAYAHGKGVVHRDIKPGNLLVDQDGVVKILDMGLARLETLDVDQDQLTGTGQIMGTVDYMAPEQAMDTRQADARSDVYSLGVTLWYLLTGRPLFAGDTAMNKMMAHMHTAVPSLTDARGEVPPEIEAVFRRMVAKKPADRFQSMHEVAAAIQSLPHSETAAGPPSIDLRGGPSSLGPLGTDATQTLQQPKAVAVDENTARLSAVDIDTAIGVKKAARHTQPKPRALKPLHLAIAGGTAGTFVVLGMVLFAFSGSRDVTSRSGTGRSGGDSAAEPASALDGVASVATTQPQATPKPALETVSVPGAPQLTPRSSAPAAAVAPFDASQARKYQEAWAKHLGVPAETTNSVGQAFVVIPPGTFSMGDGARAVHVSVTHPVLMAKTEVTQGQWRNVMGTAPWKGAADTFEGDDVAAWNVSLEDAKNFCTKLTERERGVGTIDHDQTYRLPVAAEWEYACRAGTHTKYFFGDDASRLEEYAWFRENADRGGAAPSADQSTASEPHAHRVGLKKPNPWGLFDVHGNAWERCDAWSTDHPQSIIEPPASKGTGYRHSADAFGGCWNSEAADCGSAVRFSVTASGRAVDIGLRVVLSAPTASRQGDRRR